MTRWPYCFGFGVLWLGIMGCGEDEEPPTPEPGEEINLTFMQEFLYDDDICFDGMSEYISGCVKRARLYLEVLDGNVQQPTSQLGMKPKVGLTIFLEPDDYDPDEDELIPVPLLTEQVMELEGAFIWRGDTCFDGHLSWSEHALDFGLYVVGGQAQMPLYIELSIQEAVTTFTLWPEGELDPFFEPDPSGQALCNFDSVAEIIEQEAAEEQDTGDTGDDG